MQFDCELCEQWAAERVAEAVRRAVMPARKKARGLPAGKAVAAREQEDEEEDDVEEEEGGESLGGADERCCGGS